MLKRNAAQCLHCKEVVESKHRHEFVACSCFNDRITMCCKKPSGRRPPDEVMGPVYCDGCDAEWPDSYGVAVDGGLSYVRRLGNPGGFIDLTEEEEDA